MILLRAGWFVTGVLVLASSACEPAEEGSAPTRSDDVVTVANARQFGGVGGEFNGDSIFLHRVRSAVLLPSGGAAVGVQGAENQVVFLDSSGGVLEVVGRTGSGPGDFRSIDGLFMVSPDTVAVWDARSRRITMVSESGPGRTIPMTGLPRSHEVVGFLRHDLLVSTPSPHWPGPLPDTPDPGALRAYTFWDIGQDDPQDLRVVEGEPEARSPEVSLRLSGGGMYNKWLGSSCLPRAWHVVQAGGHGTHGLWVVNSADRRLVFLDSLGARTVEVPGSTPEPVTSSMRSRFRERLEGMGAQYGGLEPGTLEPAVDRLGPVGEPLPSLWSGAILDHEGGIWLERAVCFESPEVRIWDVFGADGDRRRSVGVPADATLLSVRGDRVLALRPGSLGLEALVLFTVPAGAQAEFDDDE